MVDDDKRLVLVAIVLYGKPEGVAAVHPLAEREELHAVGPSLCGAEVGVAFFCAHLESRVLVVGNDGKELLSFAAGDVIAHTAPPLNGNLDEGVVVAGILSVVEAPSSVHHAAVVLGDAEPEAVDAEGGHCVGGGTLAIAVNLYLVHHGPQVVVAQLALHLGEVRLGAHVDATLHQGIDLLVGC